MGLFSKSKKLKFKKIPSTPEQDAARSYLVDLQNQTLQFPEMGIADLTGTEQQVQGMLPSYLTDMEQDYGAARGYYNDVLNDRYDPRTSPFYQGFRQEMDISKAQGQLDVARAAQKAGVGRGTPSVGVQGKVGAYYDSQTLQMLGQLLENERNRKASAAAALPALSSQYAGNMAAASEIAAQERRVEQAKLAAAYDAALQTLLAPYNYNATIAMALLNEPRYVGVQTGGGMTDLGFGLRAGAPFMPGVLSALGGLFGGGGAAAAGAAALI